MRAVVSAAPTFGAFRASKKLLRDSLFQPVHQALLSVIASGKIGDVSHAQVAAAHGYHGTSLLRHYLGIGAEDCTIRATTFSAPLTQGPGRGLAMPDEETVGESEQTVAWLMFDCAEGTRFGVFDWNQEIYRSCAPTYPALYQPSHAPDKEADGPSVLSLRNHSSC